MSSESGSCELGLEVQDAALERCVADVLALPLFVGERPLRGAAARADWRLCGRLSALLMEGQLSGEPGDAALVSSSGGLRAPWLLLLGGGRREDLGPGALERFAQDAVARAVALRAGSLALPLVELGEAADSPQSRAALVSGAVAGLVEAGPGASGLLLRLLVARDDLARCADQLRRARPRNPEGVKLRFQAPGSERVSARVEASAPGARLAPPGARS